MTDIDVPLNALDITSDGGVYKVIEKEGNGDYPKKCDEVEVTYVGYCNGNEFDRNIGGYPFVFKIGDNKVISGWEEAIPTMRVGEIARLIIRSDYGYGKSGDGDDIPPDSTLDFRVELCKIKSAPSSSRGSEFERLQKLRIEREKAAKQRQEKKDETSIDRKKELEKKLQAKQQKGKGRKGKKK